MNSISESNSAVHKNLDKALDLINLLSSSSTSLSVIDISTTLGITRSTAYNILESLVSKNLAEKDKATSRYCLGYKVMEYAESYYHHYPFLYIAEKYINAMCEKWSMKVNVSVYKEPDVSLLIATKDPNSLIPRVSVGRVRPAHATAAGKILLSALSENELNTELEGINVIAYTPDTITDLRSLREAIKEVRVKGYAVEIGELMPRFCCVAAPIRDRSGSVIAAISISANKDIFLPNLQSLTSSIVASADDISAELGYNFFSI